MNEFPFNLLPPIPRGELPQLPVMQTNIDAATPEKLIEWLDAIQGWQLPPLDDTTITIKADAAKYAALVRGGEPGEIAQARVWLHGFVNGWPGGEFFNIFEVE